jgi:hypothetical protein
LNFFACSIVYIYDEGTTGGSSMRNIKQTLSPGAWLPNPDRPKTIVIADDGSHAAVVVLDTAHPASGSCFDHGGRTWVIRGRRHHSRVLVAEPVNQMEQ